MINEAQVAALTQLRHTLHQFPELSSQEGETAERIMAELCRLQPDELLQGLGGAGVAAVFNGEQPGPTTLLRAELDALPIEESNTFEHRSKRAGVSHKCGHDGHMVILMAVAEQLAAKRPVTGRVVLLFQPAEETGDGARQVVEDPQFAVLKPDFAFALHNTPGLALGQVQVRAGTFNCASRGLAVRFAGRTSHAAHPENGISPAHAMCQLITELQQLPQATQDRSWVTVVHAHLGEVAFGTSPGDAVVMATLRTESDEAMASLVENSIALAARLATAEGLSHRIEWHDVFQASVNSQRGSDEVLAACLQCAVPVEVLEQPLRWSEDFGCLSQASGEGAMFTLGAGEDSPQLHNPDYDFPDALILVGAKLFLTLVDQINNKVYA